MPDRIRDHYDVLCPLNAIICHHRHQRGVDFPDKIHQSRCLQLLLLMVCLLLFQRRESCNHIFFARL